ncbi:unnamed protein product [Prorocentrum cordatum]|uniref:Uncharacterized protein n=1 Tax=Prorocentrum cordatum TaxID=2364126 RepID=A0ABN9PMG3_9DINO|nr:unnamed protein product [Polarella glacialis]
MPRPPSEFSDSSGLLPAGVFPLGRKSNPTKHHHDLPPFTLRSHFGSRGALIRIRSVLFRGRGKHTFSGSRSETGCRRLEQLGLLSKAGLAPFRFQEISLPRVVLYFALATSMEQPQPKPWRVQQRSWSWAACPHLQMVRSSHNWETKCRHCQASDLKASWGCTTSLVSSKPYKDDDGDECIKITWYNSGFTNNSMVQSWMNSMRITEKARPIVLGDEVEALPNSRFEGKNGVYYEPGDRGRVSSGVFKDSDGDECIKVTWYTSGRTNDEIAMYWMKSFKLVTNEGALISDVLQDKME